MPARWDFLHRFGADVRAVECDTDGMLPDSLEYQIQAAIDEGRRPKAVYTIPTFQNPLGFVESLPRRAEVTEITARYGVPVWEDDCYVDLNFDHPDLPPAIRSLDDSGRTIYVASFSKNIAPGMRLGYVNRRTGPPGPDPRHQGAPAGSASSRQWPCIVSHRPAWTPTSSTRAPGCRPSAMRCWRRWRRISVTVRAGPGPPAACSCSCRCSTGTDTVAAAERAAAHGVRFAPGTHTAADGVSGRDRMRLCYGWNRPDEMDAAITELAAVLQPEPALASR